MPSGRGAHLTDSNVIARNAPPTSVANAVVHA
jgi:hypothetical protein